MEFESSPTKELRELKFVLHRIVKRITRQMFTTPLQTQIDVGTAIGMVQQVDDEDFPARSLVSRTLADLLREVGKKRPDYYRYILVLEDAVRDLEKRTGPDF